MKRPLMSTWSVALLGTQVAVATPAATPESASDGLTIEQALTLPAPLLARMALGLAGNRYVEVRRPFLGGPGRSGFSLSFATRPQSAGYPGLCRSDTIDVYFSPSENTAASDGMRVHTVDTGSAFKIVADTRRLAGTGWNDAYGRRLDALCAVAGPVFADPNGDGRQPHFFFLDQNSSVAEAYFAARVLQEAVEGARTSTRLRITCDEDPAEPDAGACADPRALVANLELASVWGFEVEQCEDNSSILCVEAGFARSDSRDDQRRRLLVSFRTTANHADPPTAEVGIAAIHIEHGTIEY
jgi:hypothetical protein